jgi:PKD repeat protein
MRLVFGVVFCYLIQYAMGQPTQADFTIPSTICLQESVKTVNTSSNASQNFWDFCGGDLSQQPTANVLVSNYGGYGTRVEIIESAGQFFGFFLSGGTNSLYRLSFGTNINNAPTITNLGGVGLNSNQLRAIDIVNENGSYYGFIVDSDKNKVYRISFGVSLTFAPSNAVEIFSGAPLNTPYQITSVSEGALKYLFITNSGDGKLVRLRFDNSYSDAVTESQVINITTNWLNAISFIKAAGRWYCMTGSPLLSQVQKVDFVNGLSDNFPVVTTINIPSNPMGLEFVNENGNYYAFVQTRNSTLSVFRLDFGESIETSPSISELNNFGYGSSEIWNFSMFNYKSSWVAFGTESISSNIFRLQFPNNCFSQTEYSEEIEPVVYSINPGTYKVSLTTKDLLNNFSYKTKSLEVSNNIAPDIDFVTQNVCANHDVNFTHQNISESITNFNWYFGESNSSTDPNPTHQYTTNGDYNVSLQVTASNGCYNYIEKTVSIYDQPVADFTLPSANPFCTNQNYLFENTSTTDPQYPVAWEWSINGSAQSNAEDFNYAFNQTTSHDITLKASIPGCESTVTKNIASFSEGPIVDFSFTGRCEDQAVSFTNNSSGSITGYNWNFGDGQTASSEHASNIYAEIGSYVVTLEASGPSGCLNSITKQVPIYSMPAVSFAIEAPPFSCSGTNSMFINSTPNPVDSNISSWLWDFGDVGSPSNSSTAKTPQHIYSLAGDYIVSLRATTNFGCESQLAKPITISQAPEVDFSNSAPCQDVNINFQGVSSEAQSWYWQIGSSFYTGQNPTHKFVNSGTYPISVTVEASNGCIGTASRSLIVAPKLIPDFNALKYCVGEQTLFTDLTNDVADPVVQRNWVVDGNPYITSAKTITHVFSSVNTYAVSLTLTTQTGCVSPTTVKNVTVGNKPQASFMATPEVGGTPLQVQFSNTSTGAVSYVWNFNDPGNTTSTQVNPNFTFQVIGDYQVQLTAVNAVQCSHTTSKLIQAVQPSLNVSLTQLKLLETASSTIKPEVTILNNSNVPISNVVLRIDVDGRSSLRELVSTPIGMGGNLTYTMPFEIYDPALLKFICVSAELTNDSNELDNRICETIENNSFYIPPYPNPAKEQVNVEFISNSESRTTLRLTNSFGSEMLAYEFESQRGFNRLPIQVSSIPSGVYLLTVEQVGLRKTYRIIITH